MGPLPPALARPRSACPPGHLAAVLSPAPPGGAFVQPRTWLLCTASSRLSFCKRDSAVRLSGPSPYPSDAFPRLSPGPFARFGSLTALGGPALTWVWFLAGVWAPAAEGAPCAHRSAPPPSQAPCRTPPRALARRSARAGFGPHAC